MLIWVYLSLSEIIWVYLSLSDSIWVYLSLSEFIWVHSRISRVSRVWVYSCVMFSLDVVENGRTSKQNEESFWTLRQTWKAAGVVWKKYEAKGFSSGKTEAAAWGFASGKSQGILAPVFQSTTRLFNSLSEFGFTGAVWKCLGKHW